MRTAWTSALLLGVIATGSARADQLYFRDGSARLGRVVADHGDAYTFAEQGALGTERIDKHRVRFAVYDDPGIAAQRLGLAEARAELTDSAPALVRVVPADGWIREALASVRQARKYVYLMTYSLGGIDRGEVGELFDALKERAAEGVNVYVIAPAGNRAHPGVRIAAMNAADSLAASGIQVRLLTGNQVQHKKLLIVDARWVLLGSSNLTEAGLGGNLELNLATDAPGFVEEAVKDFRSMLRRARSPHTVSF